MKAVIGYVVGGTVALLTFFSLLPSVLDQYQILGNETVEGGTDTYFQAAPAGVEAAVGAVLTIFGVLVLWKMYKDA